MTEAKRAHVMGLGKEGMSVSQIVHRTKYDRRFVKRWYTRESTQDLPRTGRPPKLTANMVRKIRAVIKVRCLEELSSTTRM